ncbi:helix-turn-helix domain-containing protein [Georgenia sp. MJ206]|uniref:helix-turn-helix domain-containing protein n=1 Tax=Georgenia wangjunii TaxID=3117730 RepID=UPI002F26782E
MSAQPVAHTPRPRVARLSPTEAAEIARRHVVTIYKALEDGRLHGSQPVKGGRWLVREDCLDAWLDGVPCEHRTNVRALKRG